MTNFLLHLAQRSVGLAPLVRARTMPALEAAAPAAAIGEAAPVPSYPRAAAVAEPSPVRLGMPPRMADETPRFAPLERPATAPQAPEPVPMPWRMAETAEASAPAIPRPAIEIETRPARPAAEPTPATATELPRDRPEKTVIIQATAPAPPTILPAATPDADMRDPAVVLAAPSLTPSDRREVTAPITPRDSEPCRADPKEPARSDISLKPAALERHPIARFEPAPARPVAPPTLPPTENRVVQVRIGAIEIHGAAPPAAASSAPVAVPARAALAVGFDGFSRLRSYAPWEW
jgi:hypothetical protein